LKEQVPSSSSERRVVRVTGTVQGVGYRPFAYRHAVALGLKGFVKNDESGVLLEVEGDHDALDELCLVLEKRAPPLARVDSLTSTVEPGVCGFSDFCILDSGHGGSPSVSVSVDTATCPACLGEVEDPSDRRFRYPFTNCTDCGPRYTIVVQVPYDRASTTMARFEMCPECRSEYEDPTGRRFHAQPNSCPGCGPVVSWCDASGRELCRGDDAIVEAVRALVSGSVVALKGIGGYHLAVDATDEGAVARLRRRKSRDDKPFAVMVGDLEAARSLCVLDDEAQEELSSFRRPILLAPRRPGNGIARGVAPGLPEIGIMLAYTPLHHLVTKGVGRPLVMTSGNLSDDPIAYEEPDAFERLGPLVDGVLTHNRPILVRCDDSVLRSTPSAPWAKGPAKAADALEAADATGVRPRSRLQILRRSRGYAPEPMMLAIPARRDVLAVGAELKNTISVTKGGRLVSSHHVGDLEHLSTYRSFLETTRHICELFGVTPEVAAHDLHPEYLSTKWALESGLETVGVQHHHAHVASCMVEHRRSAPVLGLAFDGLGYGPDGTFWGGEMLVADLFSYERVAHLRSVCMPGGTAAIREPWRMAMAWVAEACGAERAERLGDDWDSRSKSVLGLVERGHGPATTSVGRLFDAVAAILGIRRKVTFEGQAAMELEALARSVDSSSSPGYSLDVAHENGTSVLDPRPMLGEIVGELERGTSTAAVAAGFHESLGRAAAFLAEDLCRRLGLDTVVLTGGVFQNSRLTEIVARELRVTGLETLVHGLVPPNDGGISVGQAAIAATVCAK
jgi:hydrogenase maturation protein HypF